jgi:hypothetical protein
MDRFSSAIKDQLIFNKKIELQLAQLTSILPFATNLEKVNAITTRGGKSTHDPPCLTRTGKAPMVCRKKKRRMMKSKKLHHKSKSYYNISMTPLSYCFHAEIEKPKWMSSLVSLWK